jgi:hypothetical protein
LKRKRKIIGSAVAVLLVLAVSLSVWTGESPTPLAPQSSEQLKDSVIAFAPTRSTLNFSDFAGTFRFTFGFDYPNVSIQAGSATVFKVYIALIFQQLLFSRGVSLKVKDANLLVDGRVDKEVKAVTTLNPALDTVSFDFVNTSIAAGVHTATARILVTTIDEFYVGYLDGTTQLAELNGTFIIGSTN